MNLEEFYLQNKNTPSDINEHLETLYTEALAYKRGTIIELGVREGKSTSAFLLAISKTKGILHSCDINEPFGEITKFLSLPFWKFTQGDSVWFLKHFKWEADIVFIDTSHEFTQTLQELEYSYKILNPIKGKIILHDTHNLQYKDVWAAIRVFLDRHKSSMTIEQDYENNNGLTILKRTKNYREEVDEESISARFRGINWQEAYALHF